MSTSRKIDFRYAPAVRWTCIGRPDDPYKTLVSEDGALLYDFERNAGRYPAFRFKRVLSFGLQTDQKPVAITQETESARVPILKTTIRYPKVTLELHAFGHQHGEQRTDVVLWQIRAEQPFLTGLRLDVQAIDRRFLPRTIETAGHHIFAFQPDQVKHVADFTGGAAAEAAQQMVAEAAPVAFVSHPHPLYLDSAFNFGPTSGLTMAAVLVNGERPLTGAILIPLNHDQIDDLDYEWAIAAEEQTRNFWQGYAMQPLPIHLPDADVAAMVTACARNIMQAREIKDGLAEFQVGPTIYRGLWVVDGHFFLEAAQYLGHATDAFRGIDALLRRVDAETGAIEELKFHAKETGIALATMVRQCELMGDLARLNELWPIVQQAVAYIQSLREASKKRGPDAPEYGLMPRSFADGGLGGFRAEYTTTLWTLIGLKEVARIAPQLGHDADANRFQAAFDDLLAAFRRHAARDIKQLMDGTPYLPILKPGSGDHHWQPEFEGTPEPWQRVNPGTATWALAHAIYPGQIFAPDDPLVQNFCHYLDLVDDEEGIPAETGWLPYQGSWGYAASFYAHVWLYAGRPDKAVDYLYAFANHAAPTRVWREEQSFRDSQLGQIIGDMPHNWASVEFVRLVRHLLIFERGDVLELLPGLPSDWLVPERPLALQNSPTRFGPVSLNLQLDAAGQATLTVKLCVGGGYGEATAVLLHLPPGYTLTQPSAIHDTSSTVKIPFVSEQQVYFVKEGGDYSVK